MGKLQFDKISEINQTTKRYRELSGTVGNFSILEVIFHNLLIIN